jgi:ADP-ribose pyrophosphatase YjhB (NUDIX family)
MQPFSHCHFCGAAFAETMTKFPRICAICGKTTFRNPLPVAVLVIPIANGVLAVRRAIPPHVGKFALPGGYINDGETWQAAAVREVMEETGLVIEAEEVQIFDAKSAPDGTLLVFGLVEPLTAEQFPTFIANDEASELKIVTDSQELAFPLHIEAMNRYMDMFKMFQQMSGVFGLPVTGEPPKGGKNPILEFPIQGGFDPSDEFTFQGDWEPPLKVVPKSLKKAIYQLKITLKDSKPPIWRRVLVPATITLKKLHRLIQVLMDWEDYHLHDFSFPQIRPPMFTDGSTFDEPKTHLNQLLQAPKEKLNYEYDFGDSWAMEILLEKVLEPDANQQYPVCIKGVRAAPPEDCGGIYGYYGLLDTLANPDSKGYEDAVEWLGGETIDPEFFDLEGMNQALRRLK